MTDTEIIALFFQRNEDAISESSKTYGAYCTSIACGILGSEKDAEECVNDTWLRAWNAIPPTSPKSLKAYFGKITRNLAIDRLRTGRVEERAGSIEEIEEIVPDTMNAEDEVISSEIRGCINNWLGGLEKQKRDIFVCRYYFCRSNSEIAEKFGLYENRVRSIISKLRKSLAEYLEERGYTV